MTAMQCSEVKDLIQLYMDNELETRSTLSVRRHLEACPSCSRLLDSLLRQDRLLREQGRAEPVAGEALREKILGAIRPRVRYLSPRRVPRLWWRAGAVAAVALLAALVVLREVRMPGLHAEAHAAAASDHAAHCSVDSLEGSVADPVALAQLASTHALRSSVPDLAAFGYGVPRGRVCRIEGVEFLHLVFHDASRRPVSVFLRARSGLIAEGLSLTTEADLSVASVSESGVDILLVAPGDGTRVEPLIQSVAAQIRA